MSLPPAPSLELVGTTEVDITVTFKPLDNISLYQLQWKQIQQDWDQHTKSSTIDTSIMSGKPQVQATDLDPGTTYCVRLSCVSGGGELGEASRELVVDTEQVGCTPTPKKSCCVIL